MSSSPAGGPKQARSRRAPDPSAPEPARRSWRYSNFRASGVRTWLWSTGDPFRIQLREACKPPVIGAEEQNAREMECLQMMVGVVLVTMMTVVVVGEAVN